MRLPPTKEQLTAISEKYDENRKAQLLPPAITNYLAWMKPEIWLSFGSDNWKVGLPVLVGDKELMPAKDYLTVAGGNLHSLTLALPGTGKDNLQHLRLPVSYLL